ncbi:caspase family protein [Kribbella sp. NBC_01505]|uniref:caspase family protein n=1 Tax=Kribbella sp. NBC_01505 TaxID=2903580 RepID=UPI0038656F1E
MDVPNGDRSRAVLIGTSRFANSNLPALPAVRRNLSALSRALTDPTSGILPAGNCDVVLNPDSPDAFMRRLRQAAGQAEDLLLVYYAGHGLRHHRREDDLYLTVQRTDPDGLDGSAVEFRWVRDVVAESSARARLLILDCCYSGLALERMSVDSLEERELTVVGTSVMAATPKNKRAHSPAGEQYTAYTGELLGVLENGSPLAGQPLTVINTHRLLRAALAKKDLPQPVLRADNTSGEILLRRTTSVAENHAELELLAPVEQTAPVREVPLGLQYAMELGVGVLGFVCVFSWGWSIGALYSLLMFGVDESTTEFAGAELVSTLVTALALSAFFVIRSWWRRIPLVPRFSDTTKPELASLVLVCIGVAVSAVTSLPDAKTGFDKATTQMLTVAVVTTAITWVAIFGQALLRRLRSSPQRSEVSEEILDDERPNP